MALIFFRIKANSSTLIRPDGHPVSSTGQALFPLAGEGIHIFQQCQYTAMLVQMAQTLPQLLDSILSQLQLNDHTELPSKILAYLDLLDCWNRAYNLTAISNPYDRITKHIADSLVVKPYLIGDHWLDVGSGAGLPGIPLALVSPHQQWTLLDSNAKKTRFLVQVKAVLGLANVTVVQSTVENYIPTHCFDGVIARAWTGLSDMIFKTKHLYPSPLKFWGCCRPHSPSSHSTHYAPVAHGVDAYPTPSNPMGSIFCRSGCRNSYLWAMKGIYPSEELAAISQPYEVYRLQVPNLAEQRHLVRITMESA